MKDYGYYGDTLLTAVEIASGVVYSDSLLLTRAKCLIVNKDNEIMKLEKNIERLEVIINSLIKNVKEN